MLSSNTKLYGMTKKKKKKIPETYKQQDGIIAMD
jgi:hypothetical protein